MVSQKTCYKFTFFFLFFFFSLLWEWEFFEYLTYRFLSYRNLNIKKTKKKKYIYIYISRTKYMYICCEKIKWHLYFYLTFFVIYFNFPFCVMILKTEWSNNQKQMSNSWFLPIKPSILTFLPYRIRVWFFIKPANLVWFLKPCFVLLLNIWNKVVQVN